MKAMQYRGAKASIGGGGITTLSVLRPVQGVPTPALGSPKPV